MNYFIFSIFLVCVTNLRADLSTEIQYGRAIQDAKQSNWESAHNRLNQLVTDNPERADILYDSGVAAYRLKNFESAQAYFKHVTELENVTKDLEERAHFNLGNAYVETKQLQFAIDEYEKVLEINPDNQAAQDNLRLVKQMLEQEKQKQKKQEKQEQQQKQDQRKQDQKNNGSKDEQQQQNKQQEQNQKDSSSAKASADKQENHQQQQQKQEQQNKSGEQKKSEKNKSEEQSEKGEKNHQQSDDNAKTDGEGEQEKEEGNEENQAEQSNQEHKEQQQGKGNERPQSGLDDKQPKQKHDGKEHNEHDKEPSKDMSEKPVNASQGTQDQQEKQGTQGAQQGSAFAPTSPKGFDGHGKATADRSADREKEMDPHERWIAGIMKQQEKSDAQANKAFIRQEINKGGTKQHGQKNW